MISSSRPVKTGTLGQNNLNLLRAYQTEKSPRRKLALRNQVLEQNLGLVRRLSYKLSGTEQDEREFFSEGCLALIDAVEKFDPERGFEFSTYATTCIRNRLYRLFRKRQNTPLFVPFDEEWVIPVTESEPEREYPNQIRNKVSAILETLTNREKRLVELRFGLDAERKFRSYQQVANEVGLSKERVRQIIQHAILNLQGRVLVTAETTAKESCG